MSLFGSPERRGLFGVHNPFENPTIPLSSVGLDEVFGRKANSDAGQTVTEETSMGIPTFWRCVALMATVIAGCPLRTYKNPGKNEIVVPVLDPGNKDMLYTQLELWELVVVHLCLWGNAYVLKVRRGQTPDRKPNKNHPLNDEIVDLRPINPSIVEPRLDQEGNKIFKVTRTHKDGTLDLAAKPIIYTTYEIMHIQGLGVDGLVGLSPVQTAARTLGTSIAADKLAAKFYNKGTLLSGVINVKAPLADQTQADQIRNRWIAKNGGVNAGAAEVAVLDAETSFQPLTIPPEALQFLQSRRWQTTEIARMFGIPPHLVGDVEKSTSWGTGIEEQNTGFISYTVSGWTNRIEQRVTREIVRTNGQFCEFDMDRLLRGDMADRFQAYATAIQWGWMSRNEIRLKENEISKPGLDVYLTPANMIAGNPPTAKEMQANQQAAAQVMSDNDDSNSSSSSKKGSSDDSDSSDDDTEGKS